MQQLAVAAVVDISHIALNRRIFAVIFLDRGTKRIKHRHRLIIGSVDPLKVSSTDTPQTAGFLWSTSVQMKTLSISRNVHI